METLTASASKIILDKYRDRCFFSSKDSFVNRPQIMFLPSKKLSSGRFLELVSMQHKAVQPIFSLAADAQADLETVAQNHMYQANTVHVKFQLRKECQFGEQFLIVGDDPMFGLWDPNNAIPLDWSDKHLWSVELDIPLGKSIQFKFILKEITGEILWQPGPDRIFQTWETKNTITICEDWDDAEFQKIIEEDPLANQNGEPIVNSENGFPDSFTVPAEQLVFDASNVSDAVDSDMNMVMTPWKPMEEISMANKNMITEEDILGQNGRAATVKNLANTDGGENLITYEGDPILVPGLTPLPTLSNERDIQDENRPSVADADADAELGINEAKNHNLPELDEKQEHESEPHELKETGILNDEEQELDDELKQMPLLATEEEQSNAEPLDSNILENDMQWGRRTLHMLLNSLGLL